MLDFLELRLFVKDEFVISSSDEKYHKFTGNVLDLGVKVGARSVSRDESGNILTDDLYHPYDELPSSYTNLVFKFVQNGGVLKPHVMLKCSPAKILQGHNVFGSDNIRTAVIEMLGLLATTQPQLYNILDISTASVVNLDVTYSARLDNDNLVLKVLDYLRNVSNASLRKSKLVYGSTVYWGSPNSKRLARKAYCKSTEFFNQLKKLKQRAKRGEAFAQRVINAMSDERVQSFMVGLLRLECRFKPVWLYENGIPTNIWQLIQFQQSEPDVLKRIWKQANLPLFEALKGTEMQYTDDDKIKALIYQKLVYTDAKGKTRTAKATKAWHLYKLIRASGWETIKKEMSSSTFYDGVKYLAECGLSRSHLQNLHVSDAGKVVPFINFVQIDFDNQCPSWWVEPVSQFETSLKIA